MDRIWPRGISKDVARIDFWAKLIAPSDSLRKWYKHDPGKWPEFRKRYFAELDANPAGLEEFRKNMGKGVTTLLYGSREMRLNNATALKDYLEGTR